MTPPPAVSDEPSWGILGDSGEMHGHWSTDADVIMEGRGVRCLSPIPLSDYVISYTAHWHAYCRDPSLMHLFFCSLTPLFPTPPSYIVPFPTIAFVERKKIENCSVRSKEKINIMKERNERSDRQSSKFSTKALLAPFEQYFIQTSDRFM